MQGRVDWSLLGPEELMAAAVGLQEASRALSAALGTVLARVEATGAAQRHSGLSTAGWMAGETSNPRARTRREVRLGTLLGRFTAFASAIAAGELSMDHLAVIDSVSTPRIATELEECEPVLLGLARRCTFEAYRRNVGVIARRLDTDGPRPDCSTVDRLTMTTGAGGELHLRGRFSGAQATTIEAAIRAGWQHEARAAAAEHDAAGTSVPIAAVLRARALVELIRRGHNIDPGAATRSRVEAIIEVRHNPDDPAGPLGATADGQPLDAVTAAVLVCDAWLQPILTDPSGNPLFAGRTRRLASPAQQAALVLRDGGCVFPGCDARPSACEAHHLVPWNEGGPTDIDHLCLLCRRHHGLAHSADWHLEHHSEHGLAWHTPTRGTLPAQNATTRDRGTRTGTGRRHARVGSTHPDGEPSPPNGKRPHPDDANPPDGPGTGPIQRE
jgi:hypothetical protein